MELWAGSSLWINLFLEPSQRQLGQNGFLKFGESSVLRSLYGALGWQLPLEQSVLGAFQAPTGPMSQTWPSHQDNEGADRGQKKKFRTANDERENALANAMPPSWAKGLCKIWR